MPPKFLHQLNQIKGIQAGQKIIIDTTLAQLKDEINNHTIEINSVDSELKAEIAKESRIRKSDLNQIEKSLRSDLRKQIPVIHGVEYNNHLGNVDNYLITAVWGDGTATEDTTNHEMDLNCGGTDAEHRARYYSKSPIGTLSHDIPIVLSFIINNYVGGAGGAAESFVGLAADTNTYGWLHGCGLWNSSNTCGDTIWEWYCNASGAEPPVRYDANVSDGDLVTIVAYSNEVYFYLNGVFAISFTTSLPTNPLYFFAYSRTVSGAMTTNRSFSIDYVSMKLVKNQTL